jgi:hypothetical protein
MKINKLYIYLFLSCGCETWSLTLREERRLGVFGNRVLRGIFGLNREEVTGDWRRLRNEELHHFYASPDIITVIRSRVGHIACMEEMRMHTNFGRKTRREETTRKT